MAPDLDPGELVTRHDGTTVTRGELGPDADNTLAEPADNNEPAEPAETE